MQINGSQKNLLEKEAIALATVNEDGSPNVIPVAEARVVESNKVLITDNFMKLTANNLKRDPRVCISVWSKDWEEGYKFVGQADYQETGKWVDKVKQMKENKGLPAKAAVLVSVEDIYQLG